MQTFGTIALVERLCNRSMNKQLADTARKFFQLHSFKIDLEKRIVCDSKQHRKITHLPSDHRILYHCQNIKFSVSFSFLA